MELTSDSLCKWLVEAELVEGDEPLPTTDPQRGPAVRHVATPPPEPVEEIEREASRAAAPEPAKNEGTGTDELHAVKRVPTRGFAFDNVRNTAEGGALDDVATELVAESDDLEDPSESADLPPAPKADTTSGDELAAATAVSAGEVELDEAERAKKDLDDNITGPLPSRAELAAMQSAPASNRRVALARILPDDRSALMSHRVRTLERTMAGLMKLLTKSSDEHIASEAEALLEKLRDELS